MKKNSLQRFLKDENGASMIEYALLAALLGIVCVAVLTGTGNTLNELYRKVNEEIGNASS